MNGVNVYFYNNKIYNLEDMTILGTLTSVDPIKLQEDLKMIKTQYHIKLAIITLNHPLRNAIYCIFPKSVVIIHPLDVIKMVNLNLGPSMFTQDTQQEIAAGIEDESLMFDEVGLGIANLYIKNNTKKEATHYYRQWQGDVPLGIDCFYNVISTIDYYYEEVFNYFDFKNIVNKII